MSTQPKPMTQEDRPTPGIVDSASQQAMDDAKAGVLRDAQGNVVGTTAGSSYGDYYVDPQQSTDELRIDSGGTWVDTAEEAVRIWANWLKTGGEPSDWGKPDDLSAPPPLVTGTVPEQVARMVETGFYFVKAERELRSTNGLRERFKSAPGEPGAVAIFMQALNDELPMEFFPPRPEYCKKELDDMESAVQAARMAEIDRKHIERAPGMEKIFRGFNADWNQI